MRRLIPVLAGCLLAAGALAADAPLPRLLDFGAKSCIPCRLMAPILDGLKTEFAGTLDVEFVDLALPDNQARGEQRHIDVIPTQILIAPDGRELWRHVGYISRYGLLAKWRDLGYDFAAKALASPLQRYQAPPPPETPGCYLCGAPVVDAEAVTVPVGEGSVRLCGVHHYYVMLSCLQEGADDVRAKATVIAADTGKPVLLRQAVFLVSTDETTGRPAIKSCSTRDAALAARRELGGSILSADLLEQQELATRCGFCDRALYPVDGAQVTAGGLHTYGCCSHCAMGVAARTGASIEVHERDRLTGDPIVVRTMGGYIVSVQPATAVAWFGKKQRPDGKWGSAGCFHQGFFTTPDNLRRWLEQNPRETGEQITIDQSLADKLALTPQQIAKACKIGACTPQ